MTATTQPRSEGTKRTAPPWQRVGPLIVVLVMVSALAAACGDKGSPGVASVGSTTTSAPSSARRSGVLYASCMRAHGVTNFPDSAISVNDGRVELDVPRNMKSGAQFASASRACQRDLPGDGAPAKHVNIQEELEFANCMRSHGITDFPDPLPSGGFNIPGNTNSPQFEAAENACSARPGSPGIHVNGP